MLVMDTSVVVKWYLPEAHSDDALALLNDDQTLLIAPELLFAEIGNVLWKHVRQRRLSGQEAGALLQDVLRGDIAVFPTAPLAPLAMDISVRTDRSFYDSLYLALAETHDCDFVTADERFVRALNDRRYRLGRIRSLADHHV